MARCFLRCEHLPFTRESIVIHAVRGEGGGYRMMEHVPTGRRKMLTRPGGEVVLTKHAALDELAYELALGEETC